MVKEPVKRERVTITLVGKRLDVVERMASASGKRKGDIVADLVNEVLDGIIPVLDAESESAAYKVLFRTSLNKLGELLDE